MRVSKEAQEKCLDYLKEHIDNVKRALDILLPYIKKPLKLSQKDIENLERLIKYHDKSKYQYVEFMPYADHFFGRKKLIDEDFKIATTLHKARNPHHPEFWDKGDKKPINMPKLYIIEMVCDWWSI